MIQLISAYLPKNNASQKELSKKLIRFYAIALSAVALFSILSQVLVQFSISQQQNDARVVNIAGRQRMLSQRLCKTSILLVNQEIFRSDAELYQQDIEDIILLWEKCHIGLKTGLLELDSKVPVTNSATIDSMYVKLDPIFNSMITNAKIIKQEMNFPSIKKNEQTKNSLSQLLKNERTFLKMMDRIVFQYDEEAKQRVNRLKNIELLLFFLTILILVIEVFFIFMPTYQHVNLTISTIKKSKKSLQELNEQLKLTNESLIKAESELLHSAEEKYKLQIKEDKVRSVSLIEGQEEERKRISLELHDGIGQMLTGLKLISEKLNENTFENEKDRKTFNDLKALINDTIAETRVVSFNLVPSVLNDFGVISAIRLLVEQMKKNAQIEIKFNHNIDGLRLPKMIETNLFRIVQEALNNSLKHAKSTEIIIDLKLTNAEILLTISDNGKGFDMRKLKNHTIRNGINNMRSRTEIHNGEFKIISGNQKGTRIIIKLPV